MENILNQSDEKVIDQANSIQDWSTVAYLQEEAIRRGRSYNLIEKLTHRMKIVWYKYEKR